MTPFRWRTRLIWVPAFWFMESVYGYGVTEGIAAGEESIYEFTRDGD